MARSTTPEAIQVLLYWLYDGFPLPTPQYYKVRRLNTRNAEIQRRFAAGEEALTLTEAYHISVKRTYQILRGRRK